MPRGWTLCEQALASALQAFRLRWCGQLAASCSRCMAGHLKEAFRDAQDVDHRDRADFTPPPHTHTAPWPPFLCAGEPFKGKDHQYRLLYTLATELFGGSVKARVVRALVDSFIKVASR